MYELLNVVILMLDITKAYCIGCSHSDINRIEHSLALCSACKIINADDNQENKIIIKVKTIGSNELTIVEISKI